ncbi:MAG: glycosidase, partial [Lewinella sp.]|nr:glycosidase [Lewinella sp.]
MNSTFQSRIKKLVADHEQLLSRPNEPKPGGNGIYIRYKYPVVTAAHAPVIWRYDLNPDTNPFLLERQGVNAAFNSGAIH